MKNLIIVAMILFVSAQGAFAQETPKPAAQSEIELLRQQLAEQKARIEKMQQQLDELAKTNESSSKTETVSSASTAPTEQTVQQAVPASSDAKPVIKPENIEIGFGKVRFTSILHTWFAGGNGGFNDTFRVRRAELYFNGEISPKIKWTIMIDPSKVLSLNNTFTNIGGTLALTNTSVNQAGRILQDANITVSPFKKLNFKVGQFKIPISYEGLMSSALLETVERAQFLSDRARGSNLGDVRDLGVMAFGSLNKQIDYSLGVFNGSGENQNDTDRNDQKIVAGRLLYRPTFIKGLQIGGSGVWGNGQRADRPRRDRLGGELFLNRKDYSLRAELMTGKDGNQHRLGYYGLVTRKFNKKIEGVFRFDYFDPDRRLENTLLNIAERDYTTGLNYYIDENHLKFQINYMRKTFNSSLSPSRNLILANLQTTW